MQYPGGQNLFSICLPNILLSELPLAGFYYTMRGYSWTEVAETDPTNIIMAGINNLMIIFMFVTSRVWMNKIGLFEEEHTNHIIRCDHYI